MTIAVLNERNSGNAQDGVTSIVTSSWSATAGSVILAYVRYNLDLRTITVSDTVNGAYGAALETRESVPMGAGIALFTFTNSAGGTNAVTATFSGNQNQCNIWAIEISGAKTSGAVDTHNSLEVASPGTGTDAITTGSATNSAQPALVVALSVSLQGGSDDVSPTVGTGFTAGAADAASSFNGSAMGRSENKRVTATASQTGTFTANIANDSNAQFFTYVSIVVNVLEATGGTAPNTANILNIRA